MDVTQTSAQKCEKLKFTYRTCSQMPETNIQDRSKGDALNLARAISYVQGARVSIM